MAELSACCVAEAGASLHKHRDVAICDGCGRLLLAYGDSADFERTRAELGEQGVAFAEGRKGELYIVSKVRAG